MISGRNSRSAYVFTASQWQELEQQLLTFKYLMSGIPVPPELISTVIRNYPFTSSSSSTSSRLFPNQQTLPCGWGCFQVGYGRKIDPEPGRCRRTDGKKWRCTKEACPDSKYCERHMHRGKSKSKKPPFQVFSNSTPPPPPPPPPPNSTAVDTVILSPPTVNLKPPFLASPSLSSPSQTTTTYPQYKTQKLQSTSFYPLFSPNDNDQPSSYSLDFTDNAPHWLLDHLPYNQPKEEIRYMNEMKGTSAGERILGPLQDIGYNINKDVKEERFGFDIKEDEITQKQFFHHFLGDKD